MSGLALQEMPKAKPGPKPDPERVRSAVLNIRGRPEWKEAIDAAAESKGIPVGDLIDRAVAMYFREENLGVLPKR